MVYESHLASGPTNVRGRTAPNSLPPPKKKKPECEAIIAH